MKSKKVVDLRGRRRIDTIPTPPPSRDSYSPPKRKSALRQKRMMGRVTVITGLFFVMTLLIVGLSYVAHRPEFVVRTITVTGAQMLSSEDVRLYAQTLLDDGSFRMFPPNNVLLFSPRVIADAVQHFYPVVKIAKVTRDSIMDTKATLHIEERKPYALWCSDTVVCFAIDDTGLLFESASNAPVPLLSSYVFTGDLGTSSAIIGNVFAAAHFQGITAFLNRLGQAGFTALGAHVENATDFSVPLKEGYRVKASYGQDATDLINNLKLVLQSDALKGKLSLMEYVDLRFGNRAYYKLQGDVSATSTAQR